MPKQTPDPLAIESRLLELAYTTDIKITAPALAYFAPCAIDDAAQVLEDLAARDRLQMDVDDDGTLVYRVPARQKLAPLRPQLQAWSAWPRPQPERRASPAVAAALTVLVPGAGHLYAGRVLAALMWFVVVSAAYSLIFPGLLMHLICILSAARSAAVRQLTTGRTPLALAA